MEAKTNYTLVGVAVLILTIGLISTMLWLSVGFNQKTYDFYTVYLNESAAGLQQDAPVKYNGVVVGYVKKIKLNPSDPRKVEITLSIESGTPITTSTTATLISQGITGVTYIGLMATSANLTPLEKMPGEPYPVIPARPSLFNQLDSLLKEVSESVGNLSAEAQHVFNEDNSKLVHNILSNTEKITQVFAKNESNMNRFLGNLGKASSDLPAIMSELKVGLIKFNTMAESLSQAGISVSKTMGTGRVTLDKFSQETMTPAAHLLYRLNAISANLEKVSNEMRQNPSVILRGSQAPKPGPGE